MAKIDVTELDIFYISYDEPNCEEHWADLLNKVPWAKRVHGVKGFDAAHKEAAKQSETDRFITVDGDNIVMDDFFEQVLDVPDQDHDGNNISESIFSWNAKNILNGLVYGNGGLKCWPTQYVLDMKTHEAADDGEGMEFCWKLNYIQLNDTFSEVHQTASPFQAFRAGFREGVKMSLDQGARVRADEFKDKIWWQNYNRLQTWCNIGSDVENGLWAIYGARLGCDMTVLSEWDTNLISDYDWFKDFFNKDILIGLAIINPIYFICMMIGAMKTFQISLSVILGIILGPAFYFLSPEWCILFGGFVAGTIAFLLGEKSGN